MASLIYFELFSRSRFFHPDQTLCWPLTAHAGGFVCGLHPLVSVMCVSSYGPAVSTHVHCLLSSPLICIAELPAMPSSPAVSIGPRHLSTCSSMGLSINLRTSSSPPVLQSDIN
eukprot:GGOE01023102.1.p1 GENE.GGOE01023102.1~~GGOE01023102.1.p1  ORF type:complete len:114 (+),score=0.63 GGOE01023102.1:2-343(+)